MFETETLLKIKVACIGGDAPTINKISKLPQVEFIAVDGVKNILKNRAGFEKSFEGADLIFIVAGSKTSAAPVLAEIAKSSGALTVAVAILPFDVETLRPHVDTVIATPNNDILFETVQAISNLIALPGVINMDITDIAGMLKNSGAAIVGIGTAKTSRDAAIAALDYPLMKNKIQGARNILISFMGAENSFSMLEVDEAANIIQDAANVDAAIMWGMSINENFGNTVKVTIIATSFE